MDDTSELSVTESNTVTVEDDSVSEESKVTFHVEHGDYFAMLATLLGFVEEAAQKLKEKDEAMKIAEAQIALLRRNLVFLQKNYQIEPRAKL